MARCDCLHADHRGAFCFTAPIGAFWSEAQVGQDGMTHFINMCYECRQHASADEFRSLQIQRHIATTRWTWRYYDPVEGELMEWRKRHA